jgi:hypothetical protein
MVVIRLLLSLLMCVLNRMRLGSQLLGPLFQPPLQFFGWNAGCLSEFFDREVLLTDQVKDFSTAQFEDDTDFLDGIVLR